MRFFSQLGQDRYLLENFFRGKRGGVFVDIGAYDGQTFSNTLFFERSMGWTGLCIEPLPSAFAKLKSLRRGPCEQLCVANFDGEAEFVETDAGIDQKMLSGLSSTFDARHVERLQKVSTRTARWQVPVRRASHVFAQHGLSHIDYCSIDTEGAELAILSDLDLQQVSVSVFTVENNYDDERIPRLMEKKGYAVAAKLEQDYVFRRRDVKLLPRVSIICAVPDGVEDRDELLRGHMENLARQTMPVEPIYVFEPGDTIPPWLHGRAIRSGAALTRYQAWNVALSLVATPLAMTLDLTDRLASDAVEMLERERQQTNAIAVCGWWKPCESQRDTDAVTSCYPVAVHQTADEPPDASLLWRMDAHLRAPRYPWRLHDGTLLNETGEMAWQAMLASVPRETIARAPFVIGHRRTNLAGKGTAMSYDERALLNDPGLSLL